MTQGTGTDPMLDRPAAGASAASLLPPEFEYRRVDVNGLMINCARAGSGPPVLLLHGYPQNHLMWRDVAPALAADHTVVLADLRGYGDSDKPAPDAAGEVYAKRSMAADQLGLMRQLGFSQFQLVGHDRSAASIDLVHDDETFTSGQRLQCPALVLWGEQAFVGRYYEPLAVWREYATDVRGGGLPTGHFLPEEAPDLTVAALRDFLA